jgi:hypothetical protein
LLFLVFCRPPKRVQFAYLGPTADICEKMVGAESVKILYYKHKITQALFRQLNQSFHLSNWSTYIVFITVSVSTLDRCHHQSLKSRHFYFIFLGKIVKFTKQCCGTTVMTDDQMCCSGVAVDKRDRHSNTCCYQPSTHSYHTYNSQSEVSETKCRVGYESNIK